MEYDLDWALTGANGTCIHTCRSIHVDLHAEEIADVGPNRQLNYTAVEKLMYFAPNDLYH